VESGADFSSAGPSAAMTLDDPREPVRRALRNLLGGVPSRATLDDDALAAAKLSRA
jgi:hypothetical protein